MPYSTKLRFKRKSSPSVATRLGVERLEARTLLAGLINAGDSLLSLPPSELGGHPVEIRRTEGSASGVGAATAEASSRVDSALTVGRDWLDESNDSQPDATDPNAGNNEDWDCIHDHEDPDRNCEDFDVSLKDDDKDSAVVLPLAPQTDHSAPMQNFEHDGVLPWIVATPPFASHPRPIVVVAPGSSQATDSQVPFQYFDNTASRSKSKGLSLVNEPLVADAVQHRLFAFEIIEPTLVQPRKWNNDAGESRTTQFTSTHNPSDCPLPKFTLASQEPQHQDILCGAIAAIDLANHAMAQADATCRSLASSQEGPNQSIDTATLEIDQPINGSLAMEPRQQTQHVVGNFKRQIQLGLFSVVSILISLRSSTSCVDRLAEERANLSSRKTKTL